jgi:hypothetical protein
MSLKPLRTKYYKGMVGIDHADMLFSYLRQNIQWGKGFIRGFKSPIRGKLRH